MAKWTEAEIKYLKENYLIKTTTEMGEYLNRSRDSVVNQMRKLRLIRPPEIRAKMRELTQFKKGQTSVNKGKKMPKEIREKCKHTWYQKGHEPANTKYDGAISIRTDKTGTKYKYLRIAKRKWVPLHRKIWEDNYGKLKKGDVVRFKNGNTLDCRLENLEKVDQRENLWRNRLTEQAIVKLLTRKEKHLRDELLNNPEIIELKRQQLKLNMEFKNATRQITKTCKQEMDVQNTSA